MNDVSEQFVAVALAATWCGFGLYGVLRTVGRSPQVREMLLRFRKARLSAQAAVVAGLVAAIAAGGTKPGGTNDPPRGVRSMTPFSVSGAPFVPVEVRTNAVALRAESAAAVEVPDWRRHGSSGGGFWLDFGEPFFRIGTDAVSRAHVAANGAVSFASARRPPVGAPLPDGTGLPALAPLLAPLGMVPEANWTNAGARSRFWHDAAPGRGRVFTWENALLDRLPGRRVSVQAELRPSGDFAFLYDFADALDPPATNAVIGAQAGTNGVNALALLGTGVLSVPVWRVDGSAVPDGVSVADLLCTDGVLRTPARFAVEWKNVSGMDPDADTDGDGLSDWNETFLHGTDPAQADTDGDGLSDGAEILVGADPRDADENRDGVPDGISRSDWAANSLWAADSASADFGVVLASDLPAGASASLVLGDLTIPLSTAGSWDIDLPAGEMVDVRLFSTSPEAVPLSLVPARSAGNAPPLRSSRGGSARYRDDPDGIFDGNSRGGEARLAEPTLRILHADGTEPPSDECFHGGTGASEYRLEILPAETGITADDAELVGFARRSGGLLVLDCGDVPKNSPAHGSAAIEEPLDYGTLFDEIWVHQCEGDDVWWCPRCLMYHSSENGCSHDPDCPFGTDPGADCTCPPRVVRVSDGTNSHSFATCFVGIPECCCPPDNSADGAVLEHVSGNLIVSNSSGTLAPGDRFEGPVVVFATAPSGGTPSEIRYTLVGETANGTPTNLASRVAKVWAVRIRHEPVTRDRAPAGFYNPCGIVRNETADFRFSLEPAAFPASDVIWSVDATNRAEFVGEATGRSVVVRGKAPGPVKLTVGIKGYAGPPPVFEAGVVDRRLVRIKAFAVDEEDEWPVCGTNYVASLLPVANEIFSQVGIGFVLDPELGRVACTNYLVIEKETGDYPRGRALVDLNHETNAVEVYFVRTIEAADGLNFPGGVILPAGVGGHALAHELGHACGLGDVLDFVKWKDPVLNEEHGVLYPGETARIHLPHDWGTDVEEGYYDVQCHSNLLTRLLMCGRRLTPPTNEDITYGDADGLVFVSDSSPPYEATCRIGFFTVPGHVPSTD